MPGIDDVHGAQAATGGTVVENADPGDSGQNVHLVGSAVGALAAAHLSASWIGRTQTVVATGTGAALGVAASYKGGILLSNLEAAGGISIYVGETAVVTSANYTLLPGATVTIPIADPSAIYLLAASGTPLLGWIGAS